MSNYICYLITILEGDTLLECALKLNRDLLKGDCEEYPMEPENRKQLHDLLPENVRHIGKIVAVKEIFEVHSV